jgi:hypothetical protein
MEIAPVNDHRPKRVQSVCLIIVGLALGLWLIIAWTRGGKLACGSGGYTAC